jgi:molybdopterin-containing oxidoreductase family iron-sulfur binding subunit
MSLFSPGEGRRYWRGLEDLAGAPEFEETRHREFPKGASEMTSPFSRRAFLGLMAASTALAGALTGCRRPEVQALP